MWNRDTVEADREAVRQRLARMWGSSDPAEAADYRDVVVDADRDDAHRERGRVDQSVRAASVGRDRSAWLAAITDPGRRGLRALLAAGVLIALATGLWAWRVRPRAEPVGAPQNAVATVAAGPSMAGSASPEWLIVAVSGRVARPGLVRLPAGSRVADAIAAAGGVLPGTDISSLNLARKVVDGELIAVGIPAPLDPGGAAPGPINLNTATLAQLDTLPGVGPTLAQRIIDFRQDHGGFHSVAELQQVVGIGESRYAELKDLVTV